MNTTAGYLAMIVGPAHATDGLGWPGPEGWLAGAYAEILRSAGWRVGLFSDARAAAHTRPDVAMVFGIDHLASWVQAFEDYGGVSPLIGVPVHSRFVWSETLARAVRRHRRRLVGTSGGAPHSAAAARRERRRPDCGRGWRLPPERRASTVVQAHGLLTRCTKVIYVADAERRAVSEDLGPAPAGEVVRVGARPAPSAAVPLGRRSVRDVDVVVAAGIDQRSNQVEIARALRDSRLRAVFLGPLGERSKAYNRRFLQIVRGSTNLSFLGSPDQVPATNVYARSRVAASASFGEAVPVACLEAASQGCCVVFSTCSYGDEYFEPGDSFMLDPCAGPAAIEELLIRAVDTQRVTHRSGSGTGESRLSPKALVRAVSEAAA